MSISQEYLESFTVDEARQLAALIWRVHGVAHDPRIYKCNDCGLDCRREHDHMTMGHAARLCSGCFAKRNLELNTVHVGMKLPPAKSLLDVCREFDAIDLGECNRRLEVGEKFDAACDEAMEKRQALGEKIKERLGADWVTFEAYAEIATPRDSAEAALWNLAGDVCAALAGFIADEVDDLARRNLARLGVLLS